MKCEGPKMFGSMFFINDICKFLLMSQVWSIPIQNKDIQHHLNMSEASDFDQWDGFDMFWPSFAWVGLQLCQVVGVQVAGIKTHGPKIKFGDSWLHIMNHDGFF